MMMRPIGIQVQRASLLVLFLLSTKDHAIALTGTARLIHRGSVVPSTGTSTQLGMQPNYEASSILSDDYQQSYRPSQQRRDQQQPLRAVAVSSAEDLGADTTTTTTTTSTGVLSTAPTSPSVSLEALWQVLSAASLVTGSTVGAGMLILPSLAAGPGFAISTGMFLAIYAVVLTSGLVIADVAITQHENGYHVPSSFQEFAQANLEDGWIAKGVSAIPVAVNSLVLVFAISKAGDLLSSILPAFDSVSLEPSTMLSCGFLAMIGACLATLTGSQLSAVTSVCVTTLLVAFGGLLLPGLAHVQDPMATIMAPGTEGDQWMAPVATAFPIVLTALQFQNVVPSLTKILEYHRSKTVAAIALGSFLPLAMYLAWCFAVLGGGVGSAGAAVTGPLMTIFSGVTLFGSSIGAAMSVTEEVEAFTTTTTETDDEAAKKSSESVFSPLAVALSLAFPLAGVFAFSNGNDASAALGLAGSFGSPLLYGIIPALMAHNQRKNNADATSCDKSLVPGGLAIVGALGAVSAIYVGEGLATHVSELLSVAC